MGRVLLGGSYHFDVFRNMRILQKRDTARLCDGSVGKPGASQSGPMPAMPSHWLVGPCGLMEVPKLPSFFALAR